MIPIPHDELLKTRAFLQRRIAELDGEREVCRAKLKAVETLLPPITDGRSRGEAASSGNSAFLNDEQTPGDAFRIPILEALVEIGGRGRADEVLRVVEAKMKALLTPKDYEKVPSGPEPRWRNWARWERKHMTQEGLLRGDSPHGIWEITQEGRKWLENRKGRHRS